MRYLITYKNAESVFANFISSCIFDLFKCGNIISIINLDTKMYYVNYNWYDMPRVNEISDEWVDVPFGGEIHDILQNIPSDTPISWQYYDDIDKEWYWAGCIQDVERLLFNIKIQRQQRILASDRDRLIDISKNRK